MTPPMPSSRPDIAQLRGGDIAQSLRLGWRDFRAAPQFGIFFSSVYVLGGFIMFWLGAGHVPWILATSLGFPLAAPFAAVGLYEVSRRIEQGQALVWRDVLGVVWAERGRQVPWIGAIIVIYFLFWTFLAHMIFALMMGLGPIRDISTDFSMFWTPPGLRMIAVEIVAGGALAFLLFAMTVVSLPLVLDREIDFVSAILLSLRAVQRNLKVMLLWAVVIAISTFAALLPWFTGLLIVLPVLGHASWHMYRATLVSPAQ